jgi:hypothetical protein
MVGIPKEESAIAAGVPKVHDNPSVEVAVR